MRIRFILLFLFVSTCFAAAQTPVRTVVQYPTVLPPAEIHFVDGNISNYPIKRISKDLVRVDTGNDQSFRMPLTYVGSICFMDGCTLFFDKGEFQFDKLVPPARLKNESGDVLLEGVLKLTRDQAATLMGPETYAEFRKNNKTLQAGVITIMGGSVLLLPYLGSCIVNAMDPSGGGGPIETFKLMPTSYKCVTLGGGCVLLAGAVLAFIGNSGCNRVVATYNNGLGLAYTF